MLRPKKKKKNTANGRVNQRLGATASRGLSDT